MSADDDFALALRLQDEWNELEEIPQVRSITFIKIIKLFTFQLNTMHNNIHQFNTFVFFLSNSSNTR